RSMVPAVLRCARATRRLYSQHSSASVLSGALVRPASRSPCRWAITIRLASDRAPPSRSRAPSPPIAGASAIRFERARRARGIHLAGVVRCHGALTERNVVGFSHADIEVQFRRQLKRLL